MGCNPWLWSLGAVHLLAADGFSFAFENIIKFVIYYYIYMSVILSENLTTMENYIFHTVSKNITLSFYKYNIIYIC